MQPYTTGGGGGGGTGVTVTISLQVTEPPAPVAVPVYVVVVDGETVREPDVIGVTEPTPLLTENDVALEVTQERVAGEPFCIEDGDAERVHVGVGGGGGRAVTVTVVAQVTEPPAPVAVPVYVAVTRGEMDREPDATGVTAPILWSIENEVVFSVSHESVVAVPTCTEDGETDSTHVGAGGGGGGGYVQVTPDWLGADGV